jgi:dienelactone hydrolase
MQTKKRVNQLSILTLLLIFISAITCLAQESSITSKGDISDTYSGTALLWKTATFTGADKTGTGTASRGFGLAAPAGYNPDADWAYPLVLYLHGAGGRGSNVGNVVRRPVARSFAREALVTPEYAAFVLAPQVPSSDKWAETPWENGPYEQSDATYTDSMHLTIHLIRYLTDPNNNDVLSSQLGLDAKDIDTSRLYIAGDSMGAYGAWDLVAREPGTFAAAIAGSGSGPKNKLDEIRQTPFWGIHGQVDSTVPNRLPTANDPDGAGTLGMMALLDPSFDNTASTNIVRLDDYSDSADDPNIEDTLIYTEMPTSFGHATVAMQWTTNVSGVFPWMFAHVLSEEPQAVVAPMESLVADTNGIILSINGIDTGELVLGTTIFPNPPTHGAHLPQMADDFDLSNAASGDDQPYIETYFGVPVTTVFMVENNGNDSGYFQGLDADGNDIGPMVAFVKNEDYLKTDYRFLLNQQASGIVFIPAEPIYGIKIISLDGANLGFDAISVSALPLQPKVAPMKSLVADANGIILNINGIYTSELVLGITTFPNPPRHDAHLPHMADDFDLNNAASGDDQPYIETLFGVPVTTVFMVENNGNDSGYFQGLDADGNDSGPMAPFMKNEDSLKTDYRFLLNQQASGIVFKPVAPIYGLKIISLDGANLGFDAISISGIPVEEETYESIVLNCSTKRIRPRL